MRAKNSPPPAMIALFCGLALSVATAPLALADGRHKLVGTWLITTEDLPGDVPPIVSLITFNKGGTLAQSQTLLHGDSAETNPICACSASAGHGQWKKLRGPWFRYAFDALIFSGPDSDSLGLTLSEPITVVGQHIGFGKARGVIWVQGDRLWGRNLGSVVNLDGETLNPLFPTIPLRFTGKRLGFN